MKIEIKNFEDLSLHELYEVLKLRSEVFVVEQNCVYQDIDDKDQKALHVLGFQDEKLVAYTRCFDAGIYFEEAAIGRVLVKKEVRKFNYGHEIMKSSIEAIENRFNTSKIKISAQEYLQKFYESHGFVKTGNAYLEDGIPHIAMYRS